MALFTLRPAKVAASLVVALALGLATACSSPGATTTEAASPAASSLKGLLPAEVQERGYLTFATDGNYAPIASMDDDGKTLVGLDIDLAKALSESLGVEIRVENAAFDSIIPGIEGAKYDAGMSWINDTEARREVVDFVDYSEDGSIIVVLSTLQNPPTTLTELCGFKVAIQKGAAVQKDVEGQVDTCKKAGKPIDLQLYPDQGAANVALQSGRGEVTIIDEPPAANLVAETDGEFVTSGEAYGKVHHGVAVLKDSPLAEPIAKAFAAIMENGSYAAAFEKWGLSDAAIDEPLINGEPLS